MGTEATATIAGGGGVPIILAIDGRSVPSALKDVVHVTEVVFSLLSGVQNERKWPAGHL